MPLTKNRTIKPLPFLIIFSFFLIACSSNSQGDKNKKLVGMYKLYRIESPDSTGSWIESEWGKGGESYILYDGLGHMAVNITPKAYKEFNWPLSEEQTINEKILKEKTDSMSLTDLKAAVTQFASNYVYVAKYSFNDTLNIVTHNRITGTVPSIWGTEVKRKITFNGDTIILEPLKTTRRLIWIRQK